MVSECVASGSRFLHPTPTQGELEWREGEGGVAVLRQDQLVVARCDAFIELRSQLPFSTTGI
jgi:hypothetical protein